jgi:hypothetical protein
MAKQLSSLQVEYRNFFLNKLSQYGAKSPDELTKEEKSRFFTDIKQGWAKIMFEKKQSKNNVVKQTTKKVSSTTKKTQTQKRGNTQQGKQWIDKVGEPVTPYKPTFPKLIIKSEPNEEQTEELRILYQPNTNFAQSENWNYPVVKMPIQNSFLKLPRQGRSNQKGYKEDDFFNAIRTQITDIEYANDVHMKIPSYNKPYEPDIVLFDKKINLYIDIEIDEPYDGYFRFPTHSLSPDGFTKQDEIRDLFFTESGWIVIRFTEKQVHCQETECIDYIKDVVNFVRNKPFSNKTSCEIEQQWDENQCIQWQRAYYREKYLGIDRFQKRYTRKEVLIDATEDEPIETQIKRTKQYKKGDVNQEISFDEETHKYLSPNDETGNAVYIPVTLLIERFFPFDLNRYVERKVQEENRTKQEVLAEYITIRDEAAEKGTELHSAIENFLKGRNELPNQKECQLFIEFYNKEILNRNIDFFDAERKLVSHKYNVAGTIDCLYKKKDKNEYVMIDWKRSTKLIVDGNPKKYGYGYALSELSQLDNSNYYKYCLQQNIYKYIVERDYGIKLSSMKLVVLHEIYDTYYVVNVPIMEREAKIILNSTTHKI